jgi:long-subunit acyl-CoA synthetase (AMP-forming)
VVVNLTLGQTDLTRATVEAPGEPERTPLGCIYEWERTRPESVHFTQPLGGGRVAEYRWRDCLSEVRRMAAHLISLQLPRGSQIAVWGKNSAHWILADWAIWMAGHVSVPLYPTLSAETIRYILEHSEARLLFVGKLDNWQAMKPGIPAGLPLITLPLAPEAGGERWQDIIARSAPLEGSPDRSLSELATIVYTSGSTGHPKGVMQSFRSFFLSATLMRPVMEPKSDDRMLSFLPLAHVAERLIVANQSTYYGFQVFFAESLSSFADDLRRARPTIFFSVPRLWTKFQAAVADRIPRRLQELLFRVPFVGRKLKGKILEQLGLDSVRAAVTGGAPLPPSTIAWYRSLGLELLEAYGMTENMAYSHFSRPGAVRIGYVGHPNVQVECRLAEDGEVLVKSPAQMMGYFKDPDTTLTSYTSDGFFKTGDLGVIDEEGRLRITGRVKELFKTSKGKYVAPVPIENRLATHPQIEAVCVGGANRPSTFALVLLAEEARKRCGDGGVRSAMTGELQTLLDGVNQKLDPHEQLDFLVVVKDPWSIDNGFLTPTLKIRRGVIEKHYEPAIDGFYACGRPVIWES